MTTRKLTPAEALVALRSRYDSDRTYEPWMRILEEFGNGDPSRFAGECWSILESALKVPLEQQQKPAAPVPSDEALRYGMNLLLGDKDVKGAIAGMFNMILRRIGVQGVPQ